MFQVETSGAIKETSKRHLWNPFQSTRR